MIKKIYLTHHTHMDIGYTDLPEEVMNQQRTFLDRAVRECRRSLQYRWTIESAHLLKDYLEHRQQRAVEDIFRCLRTGQMELMGFEYQPLLELCSASELKRVCSYAKQVAGENHFPVSCAMLNDIGGWPATLPDVCARSGIRYFVSGVGAFQVFLPWTRELPHLFRHRGPEGGRLLVWNLGIDRRKTPVQSKALLAVYGLGANYIINPWMKALGFGTGKKVEAEGNTRREQRSPEEVYHELEERLNAEQYPYEELMLQYGGDNRWPNPDLPEIIERINASGKLPEIELTTPSRFMELMEQRYGADIPEYSGMLADPWVIRCNPASSSLKCYRSAQRGYLLAERLAGQYPCHRMEWLLNETADWLGLYSDHTCGLSTWHAPLLRKPGAEPGQREFLPLRQSWRAKLFYAEAANASGREAIRALAGRNLFRGDGNNLWLVWNPAKQPQGGIAEFYAGRDQGKLKRVTTLNGKELRFEEKGFHRYLVELPALSGNEVTQLLYELETDQDHMEKPLPVLQPMPKSWQNRFFRLDFAHNGAVECFSSPKGETFYRRSGALPGFLEPVLELPQDYQLSWTGAGMAPVERCVYPSARWQSAGLLSHGILSDVMERRGCFRGGRRFSLQWRLYHDMPRIDVELFLAKPETLELESLYLAAPLDGQGKEWILHTADSAVNLAEDLLPGSMRDSFYAHRGISCTSNGRTWTMFSPDAPVVHPGSIRHFRWLMERDFNSEAAGFYWQIHHNMLITDSPAFQQINDCFRFSLLLNHSGPVEEPQAFIV